MLINENFQLVLICLLLNFGVDECVKDLKNSCFGDCEFVEGFYKLVIVKFMVVFGRYFKVVLLNGEFFFYCFQLFDGL